VLEELPERLVLGVGAHGRLRPDAAVIAELERRGVEVECLPTDAACDGTASSTSAAPRRRCTYPADRMARYVELRRHTDSDGDALTEDGVRAALEIARGLAGGYGLLVSSGAQRATQTLACFACALRDPVPGGVVVEAGLRSRVEDRWRAAYRRAGRGRLHVCGLARSAKEALDVMPLNHRQATHGASPSTLGAPRLA
jgi:hypothetical protein